MSRGIIGMDKKVYSNFRDFIYGLRAANLTSGEFDEAKVLNTLHKAVESIRSNGMTGTVYLHCHRVVSEGGRETLEVMLVDGHDHSKKMKVNFFMADDRLAGEYNSLLTTEELPPYMGYVRDMEWRVATEAFKNYEKHFNHISWQMFVNLQEYFRNASYLHQLRLDISDSEKETVVRWYVSGALVGALNLERVVSKANRSNFKGFGSHTKH